MLDVINLALPLFGLIFLGLAAGKLKQLKQLKQIPDASLVWMNVFIIYAMLPAPFYRILAKTSFQHVRLSRHIDDRHVAGEDAHASRHVVSLMPSGRGVI